VVAVADDDDINEVLEEIRAFTAEFRETTQQTIAEAAKERADATESKDEREKERRSGEHGRDWQTLQQRIDMGKTTEQDITSGVDHSPEAVAVRRVLGASLSQGRAMFADMVDKEEGEFAELQRAQAELARTMERLRELNRNL
jgi:hypothetical protein